MFSGMTISGKALRMQSPADAAQLVHGASGGVGTLLLVRPARLAGAAEVIGTASARKYEYVRVLGAVPVDYRNDDVPGKVREISPGGSAKYHLSPTSSRHAARGLAPCHIPTRRCSRRPPRHCRAAFCKRLHVQFFPYG